MRIADDVTQLIGNTPLVRLRRVTDGAGAQVVAKLEVQNPGGQREGPHLLSMVEEAERPALIARGAVVVEATSGNTGICLAMMAPSAGTGASS